MVKSKVTIDNSHGAANGTIGECRHCGVQLIYSAASNAWLLDAVEPYPPAQWATFPRQADGTLSVTPCHHGGTANRTHEPYLDF